MGDLKTCPFCDGVPKEKVVRKGRVFEAFIQCRKCNARTGVFLTEPHENWNSALDEAIEAWNRRPGCEQG